MKIDRYEMYTRYDGSVELVIDPYGSVCYTRDVAKLEAINAELLERAEDVSKLLEYFVVTNEYVEHTIEHFRAAIAKAKGETL